MKLKGKSLLSLFLITWVIIAFFLFTSHAHNYLGNSYFATEDFQYTKEEYKSQLGRYVLNPFDREKAKENLTVTQNEIEGFRNYYGPLAEQVENIRWQYEDRINEETLDDEMKDLLIKERDTKIAAIKKNFESDEHVEAQIRKIKEEVIDRFAKKEELAAKEFLNNYSYFSYSMTNVKTGETFESTNLASSNVFTESFGNQSPYLMTDNQFEVGDYNLDYEFPVVIDTTILSGEVSQFNGTISIPKAMLNASGFGQDYKAFTIAKIIFYIIWATAILAIVCLFTIAKPNFTDLKQTMKLKEMFLRLPIDVRILSVAIAILIELSYISDIGYKIRNIIYWYNGNFATYITQLLVFVTIIYVVIMVTILAGIWTWESIRNEEKFKEELKDAYLFRLTHEMKDLFLTRSIGLQSIAILVVAFLAGIGFVVATMNIELAVIYLFLFVFIALPAGVFFLRHMGYLNRIMKQTKEMAEGRLTSEIKIKGNGKSPFAQHAANLNQLRAGVRHSMSEQAKSERLKTELITNVSHDLRTPLTSIITYTDLLKKPDITEEERQKYIDVLDKKSARLKTLIEDLFEVSKMASGSVEVVKQKVDLTQLIQQAIGEHEEAFEKVPLDFRITMPDQSLIAYVDGQKIWRVMDNLIVNALKYSLEGTRVYVTLTNTGTTAQFTVKNVSKFELNDNVDELTERFKRADASRHTDGSGLGLAIAQSIVDLHNGQMKIDVDGDLFKVTVSIPIDL